MELEDLAVVCEAGVVHGLDLLEQGNQAGILFPFLRYVVILDDPVFPIDPNGEAFLL
jgi:hypothetical protein